MDWLLLFPMSGHRCPICQLGGGVDTRPIPFGHVRIPIFPNWDMDKVHAPIKLKQNLPNLNKNPMPPLVFPCMHRLKLVAATTLQ
jgi:hypothetical protein